MNTKEFSKILKGFDIQIDDLSLLDRALTHSSFANQKGIKSYEKLEFLGDAVLQIAMSTFLYENFPNLNEGELTKKRAQNVCEKTLLECAKILKLEKYIKVASGTKVSSAILADTVESILGAIYLDKDTQEAYKLLDCILFPAVIEGKYDVIDYKSTLQEMVQAEARTLEYKIVEEVGPSHNRLFTSIVSMDGIIMGKGRAKTKKEADQSAAKQAMNKMAKK